MFCTSLSTVKNVKHVLHNPIHSPASEKYVAQSQPQTSIWTMCCIWNMCCTIISTVTHWGVAQSYPQSSMWNMCSSGSMSCTVLPTVKHWRYVLHVKYMLQNSSCSKSVQMCCTILSTCKPLKYVLHNPIHSQAFAICVEQSSLQSTILNLRCTILTIVQHLKHALHNPSYNHDKKRGDCVRAAKWVGVFHGLPRGHPLSDL